MFVFGSIVIVCVSGFMREYMGLLSSSSSGQTAGDCYAGCAWWIWCLVGFALCKCEGQDRIFEEEVVTSVRWVCAHFFALHSQLLLVTTFTMKTFQKSSHATTINHINQHSPPWCLGEQSPSLCALLNKLETALYAFQIIKNANSWSVPMYMIQTYVHQSTMGSLCCTVIRFIGQIL